MDTTVRCESCNTLVIHQLYDSTVAWLGKMDYCDLCEKCCCVKCSVDAINRIICRHCATEITLALLTKNKDAHLQH